MERYKDVIDEICAGRQCTEDFSLLNDNKPWNCPLRTKD